MRAPFLGALGFPRTARGRSGPACASGHAALRVSWTRPESSQEKDDTMLLGIDYGTTRTVVAAVDRGNYPVISFHTADGDTQDWYPSLITARGDARLYGLDAARHQDDPDWALLRSFKRHLAMLGPTAQVALGTGGVTTLELLMAFLVQLRCDLVTRSNL